MKVLIVCTNYDTYPSKKAKTGIWLNELTHFYEVMSRKRLLIDIMSPFGGSIPVDKRSLESKDEINTKYLTNTDFLNKKNHSLSPNEIEPDDYRLIYFVGGPGAMWDFPNNNQITQIAGTIYKNGGMITAVGHGVAALLNIETNNGKSFLEDKYVTGFSNLEEKLMSFISESPFSLEDALKEKGAHFTKSMIPFIEFIEMDERLITGQNANSAKKIAIKAIEELFEK
tara:strand:- start:93 stop:773 length:681 start_codon:yes stop_codon:yes gene_type:complete